MTPIRLLVQPTTVPSGESFTLVLVNDSTEQIGYNLCTSELARRDGAAWMPVPSDRVCTMELRPLEPGMEARYTLETRPPLAPGEYRVVTGVARMPDESMIAVASEPFLLGAREP